MSNALRPLLLALSLLILAGSAATFQIRALNPGSPRLDSEQAQLQHRFLTLASLLSESPQAWAPSTRDSLSQLLGAEILVKTSSALTPAPPDALVLPADSIEKSVHIFLTPASHPVLSPRLVAQRQAFLWLTLLAAGLLVVVSLAPSPRRDASALSHLKAVRGEMNQVEHFARNAALHGQALDAERESRHRTEQDLHLHQIVLNNTLEQKIRLGRDLHDGLIQSLYATGLTLQSAQRQLPPDSPASAHLETSLKTLHNAIREVRAFILGLDPDTLRSQSFPQAVEAVIESLRADRDLQLDLAFDPPALQHLDPSSQTELLQIIREAASNALRHGHATVLTLRLHIGDDKLALLVQDNGCGFDPGAPPSGGHGLANIHARAHTLQATCHFQSAPGQGARLVITLPASST